jgi:hypothetical protein
MSTGSLPKVKLEGERLAVALALPPVPRRFTLCGTPVALSIMRRVPLRVPFAVGVKITPIVQELSTATLVPQLFV